MLLVTFLSAPRITAQTASTTGETQNDFASDKVLELSKFEVSKARDVGYFSAETTAGTRSTKAVIDIPGSISIINSELLTDLNVVDVDQALKYGTSGVVGQEQTRDITVIRGFVQNQIFRDGIWSTSFVGNQLYDLDRIEVIKGPVAMVFGNSGVLGGAINYVPRKPTYTKQGDLSVTLGAENNYVRSTLNLSGPVTDRKDIRYRLTLGAQNDDMEKDIEYNNQLFIGGAIDFDLGKSTISLYGFYFDNDRFIYFDDFTDITVTSGDLKLNPRSTRSFGPADKSQDLYFNFAETYLTATMTTQLSDNFSFRGFYRYRETDEPRRIIRGISVAADNITLNRQLLNFPYSEYGHTAQFDFNYKLSLPHMGHDISFGGDYSSVYSRDILAINNISPLNTVTLDYSADASLPDQQVINNQNTRTTTDQLSYYLQDSVTVLNDKVELIGGLRWIDPKVNQRNLLANTTSIRDDPLEKVYRYGIVLKPLHRLSVYAMKADTFQVNSGVNHLGVPLVPSIGKITEVGFKTFDLALAGGKFFATVAYFDMAQTNIITVGALTVVNGATVNEILQLAQNSNKGFEFELGYIRKAGPGDLNAIVNYYDADSKSATGTRGIRAPHKVQGLLLKYNVTEGALKGLSIGGGGAYQGNRLATANGLLFFPANETYDAFVNYRVNRKLSVGFNVDNLTNARFINTYAAAGLAASYPGRTFRLIAKYGW